jgi:hypothetical protein
MIGDFHTKPLQGENFGGFETQLSDARRMFPDRTGYAKVVFNH